MQGIVKEFSYSEVAKNILKVKLAKKIRQFVPYQGGNPIGYKLRLRMSSFARIASHE